MFEKNLEIGFLLDFYGDILPERRRDIMDLYYNDDLSLAEIAEQFGITRQAVREVIKKTEADLCFYEEKLGLRRRFTEAQAHAARAAANGRTEDLDDGLRAFCARKYDSDFSREMTRSAEVYLADFQK